MMFPIPRNAGSLSLGAIHHHVASSRRALQLIQCQDCPTELVCDEARLVPRDPLEHQRGELGLEPTAMRKLGSSENE